MRFLGHLVAMLMCLTLAGGTQACVYLCGPTAKVAKAEANKPTCHHCGDKKVSQKSSSTPEAPCQNCNPIAKDKLVDHAAKPVAAPTQLFAVLPIPHIPSPAPSAQSGFRSVAAFARPPNDLLHQFCLLLI